ncbi:aldo/keto reductase [Sodiomyces alkalinus F11]|uniref:Aldo/keto reductase n=1 Tax=Sodiomyces alkalinus (strain CBS 110278 / VKM F-3762 / F11) TaxID=1314773 RepID=A0A3N2PUM1_SODAK|nr:aldo/keto reductase [Sodiomyces alkalinus F11]ROT38189.1 aldo/keto reductase [Sodiomyces alkalinus F11]
MADIPVCTKTFPLNNGQLMPAVGLGTWQGGYGTKDTEALEQSIIDALQSGYRLIDTAQSYGVESVVGRAIRNSGVPRSEITVVTKFWGEWHHDPAAALQISLDALDIEYVDVFLMHWPWATTPAPEKRPLRKSESPTIVETWKLMEKLVGPRCRAIGVSNFTQKTLEEILAEASVVPAVNQVEVHALNPNHNLVPYCESQRIHVMGWSTMGGGGDKASNPMHTHKLFQGLAQKYGCSTGVISLSWAVQRGITVIPKSSSKARIEENIKLVTLDLLDMAKINDAQNTIKRFRIADHITPLWMEMDGKPTMQGWSVVDFGWEDEQGNWLA